MNKVSLEIVGMTYTESSTGAYVLILGDKNSQRKLPIVIGNAEAESIAIGIEKNKNGRPQTHDLFIRFAKEFDIGIREVVINHFREGVFYSMLVCQHGVDLTMVDARPSDAIAIAVRCGCDIYAYENVMDEAGIIMDVDNSYNSTTVKGNINKVPDTTDFGTLNIPELEELLEEAIEDEDYDLAAKIRDEIQSRS